MPQPNWRRFRSGFRSVSSDSGRSYLRLALIMREWPFVSGYIGSLASTPRGFVCNNKFSSWQLFHTESDIIKHPPLRDCIWRIRQPFSRSADRRGDPGRVTGGTAGMIGAAGLQSCVDRRLMSSAVCSPRLPSPNELQSVRTDPRGDACQHRSSGNIRDACQHRPENVG